MHIRLRFPCPGDKCSKEAVLSWCHHSCGASIYMDETADLWCCSHTSVKSFIQHWRFNCEQASHGVQWAKWSQPAMFTAIGHAAAAAGDAGE
jgi:hypothetical protein